MGKQRWLQLGGIGILTIGLGLNYWLPSYVLPYMLLSHQNFPVENQPQVLEKSGAKAETVQFQSRDGIEIVGWWIPTAQSKPDATLIVLHNLGGNRQDHLARMLPLWRQGINLLLLDMREHGDSGGEFFTYGYHEWKDIAGAIDYLEQTRLEQAKSPQPPVIVLGVSAGGTVAIAAAAQDQRVQGVITIGTFADLQDTIVQQTSWLIPPWRQRAMAAAEKLGKFEIAAASSRQLLSQVQVPVLIFHGEKDDYIPFTNGQALFAAANSPKQFYPIPQANHADMLDKGGQELIDKIAQFCRSLR
jgi:uncharacterized protein